MGFRTCIATFVLIFGALAWASPKQTSGRRQGERTTALDQQFASVKAQRESLQKQLVAARLAPLRRIAVSPAAPVVTHIAALEPLAPLVAAPLWDCPPLAGAEADELINTAALKHTLSPALLRSVIKHESAFRPCAVSTKGAQGLMQLMPATAEQFGVTDPFDPRQNIGGGAAFLRNLLNRYGGDLKLALSAYNAGIGRVEASGGVPNLLETQNYVSSILEDLGSTDENTVAEEEPVTEAVPPRKEDFRHITLQLSLDPKQTTSSVRLAIGN